MQQRLINLLVVVVVLVGGFFIYSKLNSMGPEPTPTKKSKAKAAAQAIAAAAKPEAGTATNAAPTAVATNTTPAVVVAPPAQPAGTQVVETVGVTTSGLVTASQPVTLASPATVPGPATPVVPATVSSQAVGLVTASQPVTVVAPSVPVTVPATPTLVVPTTPMVVVTQPVQAVQVINPTAAKVAAGPKGPIVISADRIEDKRPLRDLTLAECITKLPAAAQGGYRNSHDIWENSGDLNPIRAWWSNWKGRLTEPYKTLIELEFIRMVMEAKMEPNRSALVSQSQKLGNLREAKSLIAAIRVRGVATAELGAMIMKLEQNVDRQISQLQPR